jgi:hypothetical protein
LRVSVSPPVGADRSRAGSIGIGAAFVCGRRDSGAIARNSLGESVRITWRLLNPPGLPACLALGLDGAFNPVRAALPHRRAGVGAANAFGRTRGTWLHYFRGADVSGRLNLHDRQVTCVCCDPFAVHRQHDEAAIDAAIAGGGITPACSRTKSPIPNRQCDPGRRACWHSRNSSRHPGSVSLVSAGGPFLPRKLRAFLDSGRTINLATTAALDPNQKRAASFGVQCPLAGSGSSCFASLECNCSS